MLDFENYFYEYLRKSDKDYSDNTITYYIYWTKRVMEREKIFSWDELGEKINALCVRYEDGGDEEEFGSKGNRTVINALKRYKEFYNQLPQQLEHYIELYKKSIMGN